MSSSGRGVWVYTAAMAPFFGSPRSASRFDAKSLSLVCRDEIVRRSEPASAPGPASQREACPAPSSRVVVGCERHTLCEEAQRLGRILAGLVPDEPEVHGLVALMELQAARLRTRTGPDGEPALLLDQDRARWDRLLIGHGLGRTLLRRAAECTSRSDVS